MLKNIRNLSLTFFLLSNIIASVVGLEARPRLKANFSGLGLCLCLRRNTRISDSIQRLHQRRRKALYEKDRAATVHDCLGVLALRSSS